jgi:hypothetical protein
VVGVIRAMTVENYQLCRQPAGPLISRADDRVGRTHPVCAAVTPVSEGDQIAHNPAIRRIASEAGRLLHPTAEIDLTGTAFGGQARPTIKWRYFFDVLGSLASC